MIAHDEDNLMDVIARNYTFGCNSSCTRLVTRPEKNSYAQVHATTPELTTQDSRLGFKERQKISL